MNLDLINLGFLLFGKLALLFFVTLVMVKRSRNTSAEQIHLGLCVVLFAAAIIPLMQTLLPTVAVPIVPQILLPGLSWPAASAEHWRGVMPMLLLIYGVALVPPVYRGVRSRRALRRLVATAAGGESVSQTHLLESLRRRMAIRRPIRLICSDHVSCPMTWGVLRPTIVLPTSCAHWPEGRTRRFLMHELAHIKRGDWVLHQVVAVCTHLIWFVPFVHRLAAKIDWFAELAADDELLRQGESATAYARDLLVISREMDSPPLPALGLVQGTQVFERISAILDGARVRQHQPGGSVVNWLLLAAAIAALALPRLQPWPVSSAVTDVHLVPIGGNPLQAEADPEANAHRDLLAVPDRRLYVAAAMPTELLTRITREATPIRPQLDINDAGLNAEDLSRGLDQSVVPPPVQPAIVKLQRVRDSLPKYPRSALRAGIEGRVRVVFDILPSGAVTNARVVESQPKRVFDQTVLTTVRNLRYRPQMVDGQSVPLMRVSETYEFQLKEKSGVR